jgi:hypothetical protein
LLLQTVSYSPSFILVVLNVVSGFFESNTKTIEKKNIATKETDLLYQQKKPKVQREKYSKNTHLSSSSASSLE